MPNPQNLKPFVKGFDERRNLEGRPEGSISLPALINKILDGETTLDDFNDDKGRPIPLSRRAKIWLKIVMDAEDNQDENIRMKAATMVFERTDGKPVQPQEVSIKTGIDEPAEPLSPEKTEALLKILNRE